MGFGESLLAQIDAIQADLRRITHSLDFWSDPVNLNINNAPTALVLPSILTDLVPVPTTIVKSEAILKIGHVEDTSGAANALTGISTITAQALGLPTIIPAISVSTGALTVGSNGKEGHGDVFIGKFDISSVVTPNGVVLFAWNPTALGTQLQLFTVEIGLRVWFSGD